MTHDLLDAVLRLDRATRWRVVHSANLVFDVKHPQGMVVLDDTYWLTSWDRPGNAGYLFQMTPEGKLVERIDLGEGDCTHPGGFDFDGEAFYVPVAEMKPGSRSCIYRIEPASRRVETVCEVPDHVSTLARDRTTGDLIGANWGSRTWYRWDTAGDQLATARNPSHFIDYQDCQFIEPGHVLATGVGTINSDRGPLEIGGIAVMDSDTLALVHQVPFPHYTTRHVATYNPSWFELANGELRLHTLPDGSGERLTVYGTAE